MSLRQLFQDHYWDTFEADKDLIMKHIDFVLELETLQKRQSCRHLNKQGNGMVSSDGSSKFDWYCPNCGATGHSETSARQPDPGYTQYTGYRP